MNYDLVTMVPDGATDDSDLIEKLSELPFGYIKQFEDGEFIRGAAMSGLNDALEILVRRAVRGTVIDVIKSARYAIV